MNTSKNITILGAGISGVGAALLAKKQGFKVFLSDFGKIKSAQKKILTENQIEFEEETHTEERILDAEIVIKSPGIPDKAEIVQTIKTKGIELISEIEFASRFAKGKIIAITGSNGKTTTTSLVYHILKNAGLNVAVGGNIGQSFAELVTENHYDYYVIEVSSFQLDDIKEFKPYIAILLNITPDHLDRYSNKFELYAKAKFKITENQSSDDHFIYYSDDEEVVNLLKNIPTKANAVPYSTEKEEPKGAYADKKTLHFKNPQTFDMNVSQLALFGTHNVANSLAAGLAANILNIRSESIKKSLSDFEAVEHRLEKTLKIGGVQFINDSKATNVNATYYALKSMEVPTIWIVGGEDKGNDYSELYELAKQKVKAIVCMGLDNKKITYSFEDKVDAIVETDNIKDAVRTAYMLAKKGDNVLLSPACASFDLFNNYEQRGKQFKEEVKNL